MSNSTKVTAETLKPAFDVMLKCGLSEDKAHQEIGFALSQISKDKNLPNASPVSLNNAVSQVAYTGLSLNHLKQEAVISGYNEKGQPGVHFLPMYRGLLKIAILEKAILGANTQVIHEGDDYKINAAAFNEPVTHFVKSISKDRVPIITYCILRLPSGLDSLTLFYEDEYQHLKKKAKNQKADSPHNVWGEEMRKKSCLKRALKTVASTGDSKLSHLIALDNLQYDLAPLTNKERKEPESIEPEKKHPELTSKHPKYENVVKAIALGTHDWETLENHYTITDEVKAGIKNLAQKLKEEIEKQSKKEVA